MNASDTLPSFEAAAMDESERRAKRIQMARSGAKYLLGSIGGGVAVLAVIGWLFPDWEVSPKVFFLCMLISIAVMASTAMGLWLLIRALLNMVE